MRNFILGIVVTLIAIAAGIYIYFAFGFVPAATAAQAMPFEKKFASIGLNAHIKKEMPKSVPSDVQMNDATYQAAAIIYKNQCAFCHGLPNQPQPLAAKGEYPKPPQLWHGHGVTDDEPGETYWKVENGIRLTGMPAYKNSLNEQQIWGVTMLLKNADKLPASAQQELGGQLVQGQGGDHDHQH